jgi:HSP20 family protein
MAIHLTPRKKEQEKNVVPLRTSNVLEEFEQMFENIFPQGWLRPFEGRKELRFENLPQVDVIDRDDTILVKAALPGVAKEDLEVSTTPNTVTIRGTTRKETKEEKDEYYRCEISRSDYLRTVALPASIDESKVKAKFKDGMLELKCPKLESSKRHSVKIEAD